MVTRNKDGNYGIRYVPVVSGESIGHGYQECLASISEQIGLKVGERSKRGEFVKFAEKSYFDDKSLKEPKKPEEAREFEANVLLRDTVADVGGFLYTGKIPVKRSSRIQCGYLIPAADAIESAALEAQFHVRHVPSEPPKSSSSEPSDGQGENSQTTASLGQIPYNVEVGSALYTMSLVLDVEQIGKLSTAYGAKVAEEAQLESQITSRQRAALLALLELLSSFRFGARKGRFLPNAEIVSAVAAISRPNLFVVSPGNSVDFIKSTLERSQHFNELATKLGVNQEIHLISYNKESANVDGVEQVGSIEALIERLSVLHGLAS